MTTHPAYRAAHVEEQLARDPRVNEPSLHVDIRGGRLLVTGSVPTEERRRAVSDVVGELCEDLEIDNETTVRSEETLG
jgi:osmotically-inducible protein OsmY